MRQSKYYLMTLVSPLAFFCPASVHAQDAIPTTSSSMPNDGEIVVTAQKREQSLNDVGITITAATGDQLQDRRITSVNDLTTLVPGFTVQESTFNSTSFTMRGVGFFNSDLATPPTVSVYVDEVPVAYPAMTRLVAFDLERVEALKGPQGTLYGQNATGGAINYIAAKPTSQLAYGFDAGFGRFNMFELGGFVSGPLSNTLSARLAVKGTHGDAWQKSTTRPGDTLGRKRELQGRLTLDWEPSDRWTSRFTAFGWRDRSDTLAPQLQSLAPGIPALVNPNLLNYPIVLNSRAADWTPGRDYSKSDQFIQVALRNEYQISDDIQLTSLTSYGRMKTSYAQDFDGTSLELFDIEYRGRGLEPFGINGRNGSIKSITQELRVGGNTGPLSWLLGVNYEHDLIKDAPGLRFGDFSSAHAFEPGFGIVGAAARGVGRYDVDTYGIFGNAEYELMNGFTVQAAVRYNNDKRKFAGCSFSEPGGSPLAQGGGSSAVMQVLQGFLNGGAPVVPITDGTCYTLDVTRNFVPIGIVQETLHEDNISWKVGATWKSAPGTLLYANVSKGYKAGTFPVVGASLSSQYAPVTQESVVAYEAGFKAGLFDRKLQLNGAGFYYDYRNKQLRGKFLDPVFGALEALVTIPKSRVIGFEGQAVIRPIDGLVIDTSVTYVDTKIQRFIGLDSLGVPGDQAGTRFPYSPKLQWITDAQYTRSITTGWNAFLGGTVTYNSKTSSGIGNPTVLAIDSYTLLDLRGGVESQDGRYRIAAWAKNVTGKYHWSNAFLSFDTIVRFPARPSTYGVTFSYRFD